MLTAKLYAVSLVSGSSKVTSLYREGTAQDALQFSNDTLGYIKKIYTESKKADNIAALEKDGVWLFDGQAMTSISLDMRDNAIGQLRANIRKASSRLKDTEGHWLQSHVVKFKIKAGFYLEERKATEETTEESVTVTEESVTEKLKAQIFSESSKADIYKALLEKALKQIKDERLKEEIAQAIAA
jgi:hypothetical protein